MATSWQTFESFLASWVADVNGLAAGVETWANNKADKSAKDAYGNPTFDFTTAMNDLNTAKANFETSVETVVAL